jgi:hypothetical protein
MWQSGDQVNHTDRVAIVRSLPADSHPALYATDGHADQLDRPPAIWPRKLLSALPAAKRSLARRQRYSCLRVAPVEAQT